MNSGLIAAPQPSLADINTVVADADDRLLKASEVQRELGISRATAYRMMTDGTLPVYRFGGRKGRRAMVRVSYKELRTWIAAHKGATPTAA
jgi:excisionase family DNA binding protein